MPRHILPNFQLNLFMSVRNPSAIHPQFDCMVFMISRSIATSTVSCVAGNKNNFPFWILICLFSRVLGTPLLYSAVLFFVSCPSSI
ncbi:hypothetical protein L1987_71187 [Smallanthus sonchifolius]|uniref:Uncharacterized protein n=1 Tax=Smallanthus sonchifolius TaxID=185202 RepID=A0ACB9AQY3_9ASTR|nr:hypothetical protein L1987_71187 [Smallanthus sonchifolius]